MRKSYEKILKDHFYKHLISTRSEQKLTQVQMAEQLIMDERSFINLDHGKSGCSALTLAMYLIYYCEDPKEYLNELRQAIENADNHVA